MLTLLDAKFLQHYHPIIYKKLCDIWGSKECYSYLKELTIQNRDNPRSGFSFCIMMEFSKLITLHNQQFPLFNKTDIYYSVRL